MMNCFEDEDRIERLFEDAVRRPPDERDAFLDQACAGDRTLRAEVKSLLRADQQADGFLRQLTEDEPSGIENVGSLAPGRIVGSYQLQAKIGEGGMSSVYLAARADDQYRKRVAIKLVPLAMVSANHLRRFRTERYILASLDHPNIARLYDAGTTEEGLPYFVMEYIEGEPIDAYCDRHRLSICERLELFRTVCSTVHYAHQNLVVHRDLKPSNVLVTEDGTPKLLDFGIAKLLNPELTSPSPQPTLTWHRLLTPDYASPEQIQGKTITTASDVYSLGVLLYKLLTQRLPHRLARKTPQEIERIATDDEPAIPSEAVTARGETADKRRDRSGDASQARNVDLEQLRRQLAGDLDNIVMMALRKEPQRRYRSSEQFSEDLKRHLSGLPVLAHKDSLAYRGGKFIRRHRLGVLVAASFLALLSGAAAMLSVQSVQITRERDRAQLERDKAEQVTNVLGEIFESSNPFSELEDGLRRDMSASELLERGADKVRRDLQDQPEVRAALMSIIGNVFRGLGLYSQAEPLLEGALEERHRLLAPEHADIADSLHDLAVLAARMGENKRAEALFHRAIEMRANLFGREHLTLTRSQNGLAMVLRSQGVYHQAEEILQGVLTLQHRLLGAEHPEIATTLDDLGMVMLDRGEHGKAERLFRQALDMQRRLLGEDRPEVAISGLHLAQALWYRTKYEEAEGVFDLALAQMESIVGADHPLTAATLSSFGVLLQSQGAYEEAERLLTRALQTSRRHLGEDHQQVLVCLNNLASLQGVKGNTVAAERTYQEAVTLARRILDPEHPGLAYVLLGFGGCKVALGQAAEAESLLREALEIRRKILPQGHWLTAYAASALGNCLAKLGRYQEAEPLVVDSFQVIRKERPQEDFETIRALNAVIDFYRASGRPEEAAAYQAFMPNVTETEQL